MMTIEIFIEILILILYSPSGISVISPKLDTFDVLYIVAKTAISLVSCI